MVTESGGFVHIKVSRPFVGLNLRPHETHFCTAQLIGSKCKIEHKYY